tara:strand:- start:117 stop:854 length:738 start_codon:yes stop_codon:yes gene_type:complete
MDFPEYIPERYNQEEYPEVSVQSLTERIPVVETIFSGLIALNAEELVFVNSHAHYFYLGENSTDTCVRVSRQFGHELGLAASGLFLENSKYNRVSVKEKLTRWGQKIFNGAQSVIFPSVKLADNKSKFLGDYIFEVNPLDLTAVSYMCHAWPNGFLTRGLDAKVNFLLKRIDDSIIPDCDGMCTDCDCEEDAHSSNSIDDFTREQRASANLAQQKYLSNEKSVSKMLEDILNSNQQFPNEDEGED